MPIGRNRGPLINGCISPSRLWPHRLAVALALVTFPLIWVGGLVTTYDAGMAVPDWPGPMDTICCSIRGKAGSRRRGICSSSTGTDCWAPRPACCRLRLLAVVLVHRSPPLARSRLCGALGLVMFQGVLGGLGSLFDERLVAMLHGCVGPLFFAYLAGLVVVTSRWWASGTCSLMRRPAAH